MLGSFKIGDSVIQEVGIGEKSIRQCHHAQLNYYADLKIAPKLIKKGFSVTSDALLPPGTFLRSAHFVPGQLVDIQAKSYISSLLYIYSTLLGSERDSKVQ